jgi:endonuclease VIII
VVRVAYAGDVPEGDTIHRTASALRTALVGRPTVRFDAPRLVGPSPQAGRTIEEIVSHGKHLEIRWDDGIILHTHMRMSGSWHLYRTGERWRRPYRQLRASIETDDWVAVCFNAPVVETYREPDRRRHPGVGRLGPDLCDAQADLSQVVNLLLSYPEPATRVRDVLLDQRVMCGVGNVYRCEVLWATELSPWAHVGDLSHRDAVLVVNTAARQLRANLHHARRVTAHDVPGGLAVYGRNGQGCPRCHDTIEVRRTGEHARLLYWCPGCQVRLDRRLADDTREMDPHPAAAKYLSNLPWRRADTG